MRVHQLDPVPDGRAAGAVEVYLAADVGGGDDLGMTTLQRSEFVVAQ